MLSLIAAVSVLASNDDAKTIAMIRQADRAVLAGHRTRGVRLWLKAALSVLGPQIPVTPADGDRPSFDQPSRWDSLVTRAIGSRCGPDSGDGSLEAESTYGNCIIAFLRYPGPKPPTDPGNGACATVCLWRERAEWKSEPILADTGDAPMINGPAYRIGDLLVVAGPFSMYMNAEHPFLQLWRSTHGRYREVQTLEDLRLTYDSHFAKKNGVPDPKVFVARMRTDTAINRDHYRSEPRRVLREEWKFDGHRYIRHKGHFENIPYLSLERCLLAMRMGDFKTARRYGNKSNLMALKKAGACSWNWPAKILGFEEDTVFNLEYTGDFTTRPCRVTMKRVGDHWRIASVDPHSKAKRPGEG